MKDIQKNGLKRDLLFALNKQYTKSLFELNLSMAIFYKNEYCVHWGAPVAYEDSLHFRPRLSINNKIVFQVLTHLFPKAKNLTIYKMQGAQLADDLELNMSFEENYGYYVLESASDIPGIVASHMDYMQKVGFLFFEKLSTVDKIDVYINSRILKGDDTYFDSVERRAELAKFFGIREPYSGLISAYLSGNPELETLRQRYKIYSIGNEYMASRLALIEKYFENDHKLSI